MSIKKKLEWKEMSTSKYRKTLQRARSIANSLSKNKKAKGGKRKWVGIINADTGNRCALVWDMVSAGKCQGIWIKQETRASTYPLRYYDSKGFGYGTLKGMTE
tara:strand:+ start:949 stop:1257 length:309 start_codon:yes stop_codon:yes gene_type:complete